MFLFCGHPIEILNVEPVSNHNGLICIVLIVELLLVLIKGESHECGSWTQHVDAGYELVVVFVTFFNGYDGLIVHVRSDYCLTVAHHRITVSHPRVSYCLPIIGPD